MKKWFTRLGLALALFAGTTTAQAQTELVVDGSVSYLWSLVQGADYVLPGTDGSWYCQPGFFTHKEGDVWTFNAYADADYAYRITLDEDKKYVDVYLLNNTIGTGEGDGAIWSVHKAIWMNGNANIGFPSYELSPINWTGGADVPAPQVGANLYRVDFVIGQQLNAASINFKFFQGPNWGGDFDPSLLYLEENDYVYMGGQDGASGDNGNIYGKSGVQLLLGDLDTLTVTIHADDFVDGKMKVTVDHKAYVPTDFPTFNGANMTKLGNYYTYEGALEQGAEFTLGNLGIVDMDAATLYVDEMAATKTGEGTYKFNAVSGNYTVLLMPSLNYAKIIPGTLEAPDNFNNDTKAVWIIGNAQVGQPSYSANASNWGATVYNSIPVAQVEPGIYKIALTGGKEYSGSGISFKFYQQHSWDPWVGEFTVGNLEIEDNDYLYQYPGDLTYDENGNEVWNNRGNIYPVNNLGKDDKIILTLDLTNYVAANEEEGIEGTPAKLSVEFIASGIAKPTINGTEMTATGNDYVFVGDFEQGKTYTIAGDNDDVAVINGDEFFHNYDYFTKVGEGQYKFNAISGRYSLTADMGLKYFRIYPVQADGSAGIFTEEGGNATWVCGNSGIGFPSYTTNSNNWGGNDGSWTQKLEISISPAQIAEKLYRLTVTVGKQITGDAVFKFYDSYNYTIQDGRESDVASDFIDLLDENIVYSGNDLAFNGLAEGDTYVVVIDRTGERSTIKAEKAEDETGAGTSVSAIKDVPAARQQNDGAIYTISGVRVQSPAQHGIYIQNGKKVVK